ncbi:hypothetical protein [Aureliella helgolandensis]|uniref:hypothetical protein n=1 Tax=Aureliella helgolandensis TaxID=2527968 RepID=UPI0011A13298|nr:hypothetical protein [Aureliella helgolandensis]
MRLIGYLPLGTAGRCFAFDWWHLEMGGWYNAIIVQADTDGKRNWPPIPDTARNWAYRLRIQDSSSVE